jgi:phosphoglycerate dehydrogenase-like enzyme
MAQQRRDSVKPIILAGQNQVVGSWLHGPLLPDDVFADFFREVELRYLDPPDPARLPDLIADADVFIRGAHIPVARSVIAAAKRLKGIVQVGIGLEHIDIGAATDYGIMVANTPMHVDSVAEGAALLMLAASRNLPKLIHAAKAGLDLGPDYLGTELFGRHLGIIGLGRIGSRIARIGRAIGMNLLGIAGHGDTRTIRELDVRLLELPELLRQADFLVLSCPLTPETTHLIGERELRLMKPTAFLINVARGLVTDEAAVARALQEGWIAGAGIDVYSEEPPPVHHPLLRLPNVIATPHCVGGTWEGRTKVLRAVLEAVRRILAGDAPEYIVNPTVRSRR